MTSLEDLILRQIRATGPMSLAEYMTLCLAHPEHGYYATRDPLGADFTTAPEISQMFGELQGLALASHWADNGAPDSIILAEPGPGRGTLMADALRAADRVPGFSDAAKLHLVEISPVLRTAQAALLGRHSPVWHATLAALPEAPLYLVANEFFDTLPMRQFVRDGHGWRERVIGESGGTLTFGLTDAAPLDILAHRLADTKDGDLIEHCPAALAAMAEIARRIAKHGGAAIVIDYGDWQPTGDTFQAIEGGEKADPLANPGAADLTAHVDFAALARAAEAEGAAVTGPVPQGVLLERLGISARARQLAATGEAEAIGAAHRRLTHPEHMGQLFKAIAIHAVGTPPPPGFLP